MDIAFPNPELYQIADRDHLGTIWEAARTAGVQPGTIRTWVSRRKIEPMRLGDSGPELFHLPTVAAASAAGSKHTPSDPAANSRGPHKRHLPKAA